MIKVISQKLKKCERDKEKEKLQERNIMLNV